MTPEEATAMLSVTLGAIAEAARSYPRERREAAAAKLLTRAAAQDGSAIAAAFRAAAETMLRDEDEQ